ncbi:MAG: TonB-dependent receptor [Pseudomonadota bacterium]
MLILKYQRARRALLAASTLVLSAMPTGLAAAQDADTATDSEASAVTRLDTVVITAGRREQAINEIARSVIVIDQNAIDNELVKTANVVDLLGTQVPGFGAPTGIDLVRTNTLRGRAPQFLVDGVPLDYNGGSAFRTSPLTKFDPLTLGRVEVLYGPTSIYGAGASGGVVQFFTKDAAETPIELTLRQQVTFFPGADEPFGDESLSYTTTALASGDLGQFDYVAALTYEEQNGVFDGNGDISGPTYYGFYDTTNYFVKAGFDITPTQRVQGFFNRTELEEDGRQYDFIANDQGQAIAVLSDDQSTFNYGLFPPENEREMWSVRYDNSDLFGGDFSALYYEADEFLVSPIIDIFAVSQTFPIFPNNYQTTQAFGREGFRLQYFRDMTDDVSLLVGLDYDDQFQAQRSITYDVDPATGVAGDRDLDTVLFNRLFLFPFQLETYGVFGQVEWQATDQLRVSGGVRYEEPEFVIEAGQRTFEFVRDENGDPVFRPGGSGSSDGLAFNIGATFDFNPNITGFANFAQSVELPSLNQVSRLVPPDAPLESDVAIEPQNIDNYELGLRGQTRDIIYSLSAFYSESEFSETFVFDASTGFSEYLRAPERIYGFEATADWNVSDRFNLLGTFSWSEGEADEDGDGPADFTALSGLEIQPWKATLAGTYDLNENVELNFLAYGIGNRDSAFEDGTDAYEITGYAIFDVGAEIELPYGVLSVQVTNLFDRQYLTPASQTYANNGLFNDRVNPAAGRAVNLAYQITF